jgi:hypothetical protein
MQSFRVESLPQCSAPANHLRLSMRLSGNRVGAIRSGGEPSIIVSGGRRRDS